MKLAINKGLVSRPQRIVIYAPEGLGKSTLGSQLPDPLFIDLEKGTHHLDVARVEPRNYSEFSEVIKSLAADNQGFQTIVIDTIDWLEELVIEHVIRTANKPGIKSIEDFGYGKGFTHLAEEFQVVLNNLNDVAKRANVVVLAHSHVRKFELPDAAGAFDRYELKLSKQVAPLLREWCDALLFANWRTVTTAPDANAGKKARLVGGKERMIYCSHTAAWDGKNRHGLSDEEKFTAENVQRCLVYGAPVAAPVTVVKPAPVKQAKPAATVAPDVAPDGVMKRAREEIAKETAEKSAAGATASTPVVQSAVQTDGIPGLAPENGGPQSLPQVYVDLCEQQSVEVNAYLLSCRRIQPGQTWRDIDLSYAQRVAKNPGGFLAVVKPIKTGGAQ